jgi:hypothetical protein
MKKYLSLLFLFPLCLFASMNPAINKIQNINPNKYFATLEDGSVWKGYAYTQPWWNEEDEVIITHDNEYGFTIRNVETKRSLFVRLTTPPETYVNEIEDTYFVLSNGLILERKPYMTLEIGDRIFLCGYSINRKADGVVVYNVSQRWVGGFTIFFTAGMEVSGL